MTSAPRNTKTARDTLVSIENFLDEVGVKAGEANTEPGSQGGATTHPVKNVDDNTQDATEGARSKENTTDVKEDQGKPSVDSTPEAKAKKASEANNAGTATSDQVQIGTKKAPTGEDPSTETDSAKGGKEDPGSAHPARTDNDALEGGKYAFDIETASLEKLAEAVRDLGNEICADLVVEKDASGGSTQAAPAPRSNQTQPAKSANDQQRPQVDPNLARQVGWEMAAMLTGNLDKQAADSMVQGTIANIVKEAEDDATRVAHWLHNFFAQKQAQQNQPKPRTKRAEGGMPPGMGGGMPPGGMGGGDPVSAMMAGGGGAGAGGPPPAEGGEGGGEGDGSGLGQLTPEQIQQLLQQLGVSEEELAAAMQEEQGGGGGEPDGDEGGMPPGAGGGMPPGAAGGPPGQPPLEVAANDKRAAAHQAEVKQAAINYIREVVGRSRSKKAAAKAGK